MATLHALGHRVIIKKIEALRKTASGLLIIDALASRPNTGDVISVGPLVKGVEVGNQVLFVSGHGTTVKVDDVELHVLLDTDLVGVIK